MNFNLKTALTSFAPTLATMLGGPLAGTAITALETAFGLQPGAGEGAITAVLQNGTVTPETMAAVRKADQEHEERLKQMGIDLVKINSDHADAQAKIDADDRDSARKREMTLKDITTPALAWLVVGGALALCAAAVTGYVTKDPTQAGMVGTVIGYAISEAKQVLSYYFGSSSGAARQTELLAQAPAIEK